MKKLAFALLLILAFVPRPAAALETDDLLALVAMPLAVAAVSEVTDVPMAQLIDVVSLLNDAAVPPQQFIEVVRYVPVALVVENDEPNFVEFVRMRTQSGLRGDTLVTIIEDRYRTVYGLPDVQLVEPPQVVLFDGRDDVSFIPPIVRTRVAEVRTHPHGGPPGQLKKQLGLQTGAEVVHGSQPSRVRVARDRADDDRRARVTKPAKVKAEKQKQVISRGSNDDGRQRGKNKSVTSRGNDDGPRGRNKQAKAGGGNKGGNHGGGHGKGKKGKG